MSAGHGHGPDHHASGDKKIGLLIAVLALVLAFAETLGKGAQTEALAANIEASNLWNFFQAKTVRMTVLRTAADSASLERAHTSDAKLKEAMEKQIGNWRKSAERYDTEPETNEGRKELAARAKATEAKRERAFAAYHHYETAAAAAQIAIVLSSAAIITEAVALVWLSGLLGMAGVGFCLIGFLWPTAVHLF